MKAVILQPTYLPWMGYFGLIDIADVFVFYDDVQFVGRSWFQRNRIKVSKGKWIWLTVHVIKKYKQKINEVKINNDANWSEKHWKSITFAYNKAPYFKDYVDIFKKLYEKEWKYLVDLNVTIIKEICKLLGIDHTKFIFSSSLKVEGKKTDRLINILKKIGADEYISGPEAKVYIEPEKLKKAGIKLYWFEFNHLVYPQLYGDFIPYLSVIDLLFNVGGKSLEVIRQGEKGTLIKDPRT